MCNSVSNLQYGSTNYIMRGIYLYILYNQKKKLNVTLIKLNYLFFENITYSYVLTF